MSASSRVVAEEVPLAAEPSTAGELQLSLGGDTYTQDATLSYLETAQTEAGEEAGLGALAKGSSTVERAAGASAPSFKSVPVLVKSSLAAALLLLLLGGGLKAAQLLAKEEEPAVVEDELERLVDVLDLRAHELVKRWERASDDVKAAFAAHYLPSVEGMEADPQEGLDLYMRHVEGIKRLRVPPPSKEALRQGYVRHVQTLTAVLRAAFERLKGLEGLERVHRERKVDVHLLFKPDPSPLPPKEELLQRTANLVSFSEFVGLFRGISMPANAAEAQQRVPDVLAEKMANLLLVQQHIANEDLAVLELFQSHFLSSYDLSLMTLTKEEAAAVRTFGIGYDCMHFNSPALANFLHYRFRHPGRVPLDDRLMKECAANFSVDGLVAMLEELRELAKGSRLIQERRFAMENARLGPPPSRGHLLSLALFLV